MDAVSKRSTGIFEGSLVVNIDTCGLWNENLDEIFMSGPIQGGLIEFWATSDKRIKVVFKPDDSESYTLETGKIVYDTDVDFIIIATCKENGAHIWINHEKAAGTDNDNIYSDFIRVGCRDRAGPESSNCSFDKKNVEAKEKRALIESSRQDHPHRGRVLKKEEVFDQLRTSKGFVDDYRAKVACGYKDYIGKLAHEIRELIIPSNSELLQRVAGILNEGITVYCIPDKLYSMGQTFSLEKNIRLKPYFPSDVCVDIDLWLNFKSTEYEGKLYTNEEIIKSIAHTEGSHYSPYLHPIVDKMQSVTIFNQQMVADYLLNLAEVLSGLANQLLINANKVSC